MYPKHPDDNISYFGRTNFRDTNQVFGIRQKDRRSHMYIIGKTGTGKSTLLETLIVQDLAAGRGLALLDPHGDLVEKVASSIPERRRQDLVYFNLPDTTAELAFNPLIGVPPARRSAAASGILDAFKKIWNDFWGPRLEHILRNALLTLLEQPHATLADILRLFDDEGYRTRAAGRVSNERVRDFWQKEFKNYPSRLRAEAIAPIQNKVGAFLSNPRLHSILTQTSNSLDLRRAIDEGRVLLVNLSKGRLGEDSASLFGALIVASISLAAMSRADIPEAKRRDFFLYLDEFQTFTTLSLVSMLSELRKYRVGLILAHQHLSQLEEQVRDAILGNVGTMICFRVGALDADLLGREFYPIFSAEDFVQLPNFSNFLKLMIDGKASRPFSAEAIRTT